MSNRAMLSTILAGLLFTAACTKSQTGPILVSAITDGSNGKAEGPPLLGNPNLEPLDAGTAFLAEATAQGLVRLNAAGELEPALAQSWIVSDDGLRYTFRLNRIEWTNGGKVSANEVAARLRAAASRSSRNPLKPLLGAIDAITAMTDDVIEISLVGARPNFLQLLAQPEMTIARDGAGTGPYRARPQGKGALLLTPPPVEDENGEQRPSPSPKLLLRGERAALAVARFDAGGADLVIGGTAGDLPIVRAAGVARGTLRFDPVAGLFGLAFEASPGPLATPEVRRALSMAIDRQALVDAMDVPDLQPRQTLVSPGVDEVPQPVQPDFAGQPLAERQAEAARTITAAAKGKPLTVRVALPNGPGYRVIFASLARDWRAIGVTAQRVALTAPADLRMIDAVAPANIGSWYLRRFSCAVNSLCSPDADTALADARSAPTAAERRERLAEADRLLAQFVPFIAIAAPVRWSLVSPRLTGFRPNLFGIHPAANLVTAAP
jgi:oligopeptide transport system substrate-binding protein